VLTITDSELLVLMHHQNPKLRSTDAGQRKVTKPIAALTLAFRCFFILATLCSTIGILLWILLLNGQVKPIGSLSPIIFHTHEMIFGFAATVAVGFLLTAVQTWTGQPSLQGLQLVPLIFLWLTVRVILYIDHETSVLIASLLQSLWWLIAIVAFAKRVIRTRNTRNLLFIPLLTTLMLLNISVLLFDTQGFSDISLHLSRTAIFMFCVLMGVLGGRVIPFFTHSGTGTKVATPSTTLTFITLSMTVLSAITFFAEKWLTLPFSASPFMIVAGTAHLARLCQWGGANTIKLPLLWSLHLSYGFVGLGLIATGASYHLPTIPLGDAMHLITLGAMGLMIFSMMSRVSLGHTGRKIVATKLITCLLVIVTAAALVRFLAPVFSMHLIGWNLSALLWISACVIFLRIYVPILLSPRLERA
jgi:uncharacterized protein involved in response to NO